MARAIRKKSGTGIYHKMITRTDPVIKQFKEYHNKVIKQNGYGW